MLSGSGRAVLLSRCPRVTAASGWCVSVLPVPVCPRPQFYLHNHLSFILYFHKEQLEEENIHNYRVVRFEVVPRSVKVEGRRRRTLRGAGRVGRPPLTRPLLSSDLKAVAADNTCTLPEASGAAPQEIDPTKENQVLFTYSVRWEVSGAGGGGAGRR